MGVRRFTRDDFAMMREMKYTRGMKQCDIARHFNCSDATISKCLDLSYEEYSQAGDGPPPQRMKWARLTADDVICMRAMRQRGYSFVAIANLFYVLPDTARNAIIGLSWRHIPDHLPYTPPDLKKLGPLLKAWRIIATQSTFDRIFYAATVQEACKIAYRQARTEGLHYYRERFTGHRAPQHDIYEEIAA